MEAPARLQFGTSASVVEILQDRIEFPVTVELPEAGFDEMWKALDGVPG